MPTKKEQNFEESLAKLEAIVEHMETGDISLQELMQNYSEGIELVKKCQKDLARAEKTIDILVSENNGEVRETTLNLGEQLLM